MGTYLVEHNVLASRASFESFSQGGAFERNLGWPPPALTLLETRNYTGANRFASVAGQPGNEERD